MTLDKQEIAKRLKLAEEIAKEVSQMKPTADVAKDLADHVDEIVLAKLIETAKTNNMKLYTEEQVMKAIKVVGQLVWEYEDIFAKLTPIELPSDEEIDKKANNWCTVELDEDGFVRLHDSYDLHELPAFIAGAKWMKEQILNQNK